MNEWMDGWMRADGAEKGRRRRNLDWGILVDLGEEGGEGDLGGR
jgi:hypothetical protein